MNDQNAGNLLRLLPAVNSLLEESRIHALIETVGRETVAGWVRREIDRVRNRLQHSEPQSKSVTAQELRKEITTGVVQRFQEQQQTRFGCVINATGIILHTNLGRAPLSAAAKAAIVSAAGAANLEQELATGERSYRGHQLRPLWRQLTGAEDGLVVNNNAAATLLTLQALCAGREVIISRGQLIEIGGSFRLPEIFSLSGAILREVGTTNRTRISDYASAINEHTAAILHVHPSNYHISGFTSSPGIEELVPLAQQHELMSIDDIGSGALLEVSQWGLPDEPTFPASLAAGADLVLGSGDKLLGGPQAGIILGKTSLVEQIRNSPFARTVRIDKLTLAALAATLESYQRGNAVSEIPVLQLLSQNISNLMRRAQNICEKLADHPALKLTVQSGCTPVGGGSLPGAELPTALLIVRHEPHSAEELASKLRTGTPRIIPRIHQGQLILDLRSVLPEDDIDLTNALRVLVMPE